MGKFIGKIEGKSVYYDGINYYIKVNGMNLVLEQEQVQQALNKVKK